MFEAGPESILWLQNNWVAWWTRPEEVQHVSVLKATGLVEADIAHAVDSAGKYNVARTAVVTRITEEGIAEIDKMINEPRRMSTMTQLVRNRMRSSSLR